MFPKRNARSLWFTLGFVGVCSIVLTGIAALGNATDRSDLAYSYDNLLRLHVLAHSDRPEDQQQKLLVRDALIREMSRWPAPQSREELEALLRSQEDRLVEVAEETLRRAGSAHQVRVEIGDFPFPDKRSGDTFLPAGVYRAVRVVIGDGAGHNWWCVLFPPLCFVDENVREAEVEPGRDSRIEAVNRLVWTAEASPRLDVKSDEGAPAAGGAKVENDAGHKDAGQKEVEWRLKLWESLSESAYADTLRGLIQVALGGPEDE